MKIGKAIMSDTCNSALIKYANESLSDRHEQGQLLPQRAFFFHFVRYSNMHSIICAIAHSYLYRAQGYCSVHICLRLRLSVLSVIR